jgi:hypothetical protein
MRWSRFGSWPYPSRLMAEFQWWLLLVGLVAGGGLVAIVSMDARRRDEDLAAAERRAEATWIAERLTARAPMLDAETVEAVLQVHREYLSLPAPDRLLVDGVPHTLDGRPIAPGPLGGGDPDQVADDVRDDRRGGADEDLPSA